MCATHRPTSAPPPVPTSNKIPVIFCVRSAAPGRCKRKRCRAVLINETGAARGKKDVKYLRSKVPSRGRYRCSYIQIYTREIHSPESGFDTLAHALTSVPSSRFCVNMYNAPALKKPPRALSDIYRESISLSVRVPAVLCDNNLCVRDRPALNNARTPRLTRWKRLSLRASNPWSRFRLPTVSRAQNASGCERPEVDHARTPLYLLRSKHF